MSFHSTVEELSAYLDRQLPEPEAQQVEAHLESCASCHERLEGMRRVVVSLRHLEHLSPPSTLDQIVARRVALDRDRIGFVDRLESTLGSFQRQSSFLVLFAVIVALATIILLFSHALQQSSHLPVVFKDPEGLERPERIEAAGRTLTRRDDVWVEAEADRSAVDRIVVRDSPEAAVLVSRHPELTEIVALDGTVVFRLDDETVELR